MGRYTDFIDPSITIIYTFTRTIALSVKAVPPMTETSASIATRELWAQLFHAPSIDVFLADSASACELPQFSDYITGLCRSRNEKPERVITRAGIEKSFGHRLFSGMRNPSRDTVLQLAFGFEMTTDEAQQLLKIARNTPLHPKVKRDAIVAFCLHNKMQLIDAQQALHDNGLPLLGGRKHDG
jgi:hypothetical protein